MGQNKVDPPPPESKGHLGQKKSTPSPPPSQKQIGPKKVDPLFPSLRATWAKKFAPPLLNPPFPFDHPFQPWHLEKSMPFNAYVAPIRIWNMVTWCLFCVNSSLVSGKIELMLCPFSASRSPPSQPETGNCSDHCNIICDSSPLVSGKIKLMLCRFVPHDRLHHT